MCLMGDYNKVSIEDILDSLGTLQNIQVQATRKGEILDLIITDMHTQYLPSLTLPPLDVEEDKKGLQDPSDHKILIFPPASSKNLVIKRTKQEIKIRPLPKKSIQSCGKFISTYAWEDIYNCKTADQKVDIFHNFIKNTLDSFFPEKKIKKSPFDKKWFTPTLKIIHRKKQREFLKYRRSEKFKKLQKKFNQIKRSNIRNYYVNLTEKLKVTNPRNYYKVIKMLSGYIQ